MLVIPSSRACARAALLLSCWLVLSACGGAGGESPEAGKDDAGEKAVPVEVARVQQRAVAGSYAGTAPLEARAEARVIAKTSGVAKGVLVEVGDTVRAGQTLVRLDSARAALQVAQSAAQLHKLQNQFERAGKLASQQLISDADYDQIRYDLENARAIHRLAQLELSYANVKAPISGVVAEVTIKPGNFVQINSPIIRIVDASRLEATLNVPERELATMQAGLPVELRVDALPGQSFQGVVDRVSPVVDAGSGTFRVVASFDSGDGSQASVLQPGMFGRLSIAYDQRAEALVVPRNALLDNEGAAAVFQVVEGKVVRAPLQLGYVDGPWVEVRKGLALGDKVVVAGKAALREGSMVQVIAAGDDASQVAGEKPSGKSRTDDPAGKPAADATAADNSAASGH